MDLDQAFRRYRGFLQETPIITVGQNTLRGGKNEYSPCVLDKTNWENYYQTLPMDYDIRNDPCWDLHKSTYIRLMNVGAPTPEPTTSESLRTGYCGPDESSLVRPGIIRNIDKRPEPAHRLHLSDRTSLHFMRSDPFEGVLPFGRTGDMCNAKSLSHRDFKWRGLCADTRPKHHTMERDVFRKARTDLHGREHLCEVVKFNDDCKERYFNDKLMKLKTAYHWPVSTITNQPLGGSLSYRQHYVKDREEIWPCSEKSYLDADCPIIIPTDRCRILAHGPKEMPRTKERHFATKSYLDSRYPIRNYECWEEVPNCCCKPDNFPTESCMVKIPRVPEPKTVKNSCS